MHSSVKTVVFPVAGLGTRFLPATKASPKEMLPIIDKPLIQYAAEEAVEAGAEKLVFIIGHNKSAIPNHFDNAADLERELNTRKKPLLVELIHDIVPPDVSCIYLRQGEPLGLGHAVLCAKPVIEDEPFAVVLPDDLIYTGSSPNCLEQLGAIHDAHGGSVIALQQVEISETDKYGIVATNKLNDKLHQVTAIVEKPHPSKAPSTLGVVGRYLLTPRIFTHLERTPSGAGGEIQLTDAIAQLLHEEKVYGHRFIGKRFDCGSKIGYLEATVEYGLHHPELGQVFSQYLGEITWHAKADIGVARCR
ncbi:MAG: UTP--glucose-1-phosphate uridylyltransferase GalU [Chromatiales bacterium]|nr:UTP--glucose-1-phosphate uridylyltransferase GalU [Chromatiales bacterium]